MLTAAFQRSTHTALRRLKTRCAGLLLATGLAGVAAPAPAAPAAPSGVDLAGRPVTLPARVDRILLGESRLLPALAILEGGDPSARLVGMMDDFEQLDPAGYAQWKTAFPRLATVPRVGRSSGSFSEEKALALRPQVAIFSLGGGHTPGEGDRETLSRLEAAGVQVIFIDFRQNPLRDTPRSMTLLGDVLGRSARARAFNQFWAEQLQRVTTRLAGLKPQERPTVFLESRVGLSPDCCDTMTGMMGHLLDAAGGRNLGQGLLPGDHGLINPEYLLAHPPQVYIGTGIGSMATLRTAPQRIALGAGVTPQAARQSLAHALERRPFSLLASVQRGQAHAIWHSFYNTPLNVVAVQVMARWLHPKRMADVDPQQTWQELYRRFLPLKPDGVYWASAAQP